MADTHETIADIIAEVRFHAQQNIDAEKGSPTFGVLTVEGKIAKDFADRLEAAIRRELVTYRNQLGNVAKIREALANLVDVIDRVDNGSPLWWHSGAKGVMPLKNAKAALAAPPRNCDRMNVDDAFSAFSFMCDNTNCRDCPYKKNNKFGDSELCAMLFLYDNGNGGKEGGDNEQK